MEQIVASHPAIAECCVIGINEPVKGQQPLALLLIKNGVKVDDTILEAELVAMVREEIGALACFKKAIIVPRLPKTRSGKILRKLLRQLAAGSSYTIPSTIDDPSCLAEIAQLMAEKGLLSSA
jgi:propionyl-CoA synthetase